MAFFPRLRTANPALGPVVDRLEAGEAARQRVADGLYALGVQLLAHLHYEEERAGPTIRR
jgi:hypothetical protein